MSDPSTNPTLGELLQSATTHVEADLEAWLVEAGTPDALADAMRYCTTGGKRLRPALVNLAARACGADGKDETVRRAAVAIECVHAYSLVHDDLPAMDNDALRRGQPTAHVKFGEAMAILIGDALLTRAMGLLAESPSPRAAMLVAELASAAGAVGMVGGQVADMGLCDLPDGVEGLKYIHTRKTAALLRAALRMGSLAAEASDSDLAAVTAYGEAIGLAFQVIDDLLDATGTAEQLGKTPGKDAEDNKRTYVNELGEAQTRSMSCQLTDRARVAVELLGKRGDDLRRLAEQLCSREH